MPGFNETYACVELGSDVKDDTYSKAVCVMGDVMTGIVRTGILPEQPHAPYVAMWNL